MQNQMNHTSLPWNLWSKLKKIRLLLTVFPYNYYVKKNISNTVFVLEKFVWGVCQEFQKRFWDNSVYCDFYIGGDWSLSQ